MTEFLMFCADLVLVVMAVALALALTSGAGDRLGGGLYTMVTGAGLLVVERPGRVAEVVAAAPAAVAAAVALAWLAVRGPDAWRTWSGQFGLDVVVIGIALGAAARAMTRRLI